MLDRAPPDFQVDIMGSEIELAITVLKNGTSYTEEFSRSINNDGLITSCIPRDLLPANLIPSDPIKRFLLSGDLVYIDTGRHLEAATAECKGPLSILIYEKRCERLVEEIISNANKLWKDSGLYLRAFKNNEDTNNNSYGAHENYFIPRISNVTFPFNALEDTLVPFLISRQLFTGNGSVRKTKQGISYEISQRSLQILYPFSGGTTSGRGIISTRDEPHVTSCCKCNGGCRHLSPQNYMRLHLILGDSLLNQAAIFLKFGTTAIVLEMIVHEFIKVGPLGKHCDQGNMYLSALRVFSMDPTLKTESGFGAIDLDMIGLQTFYLKRAREFYRQRPDLMTRDKKKVLLLWKKVLRCAMSENPAEALCPYVDWAAKLCWIEEDMKKRGYDWNSDPERKISMELKNKTYTAKIADHLKTIDLKFHEISPRGYARILEERGCSMRLIKEDVIRQFRSVPIPKTTRACARSEILRRADAYAERIGAELRHSIDWTYISLYDGGGQLLKTFKTGDPRDFTIQWEDPDPSVEITS